MESVVLGRQELLAVADHVPLPVPDGHHVDPVALAPDSADALFPAAGPKAE